MTSLSLSLRIVWACSIVAQLAVLFLLFAKGNFRKLPVLTTYVVLNLCQAGFLLLLYTQHGPSVRAVYYISWASEAVTLVFQALAALEALRHILGRYRGIWGLCWRGLAITSTCILVYVARNAAGNLPWAVLEADRGYHLTFATAFIGSLLLVRYYSIQVPSAYKMLLGGFCFYSCAMILDNTVLDNTVLRSILHTRYANFEGVWNYANSLTFVAVQLIWVAALSKPLPEEDRETTLLTNSIYQRLSPEINKHLRLLNDKLMRLWKLEVPRN